MNTSRYYLLVVMLALSLAGTGSAAAAPPVLMVLQHAEQGRRVDTKIEAKAGPVVSPIRGKLLERIRVSPGQALKMAQQPGEAHVELYRGADPERQLVCAIAVRYFRDARGAWVPHFQLIEEALVTRGADGRWQPLHQARGATSLIVLTSSTLPNADGYYPALEFGLSGSLLQIDSWVVR